MAYPRSSRPRMEGALRSPSPPSPLSANFLRDSTCWRPLLVRLAWLCLAASHSRGPSMAAVFLYKTEACWRPICVTPSSLGQESCTRAHQTCRQNPNLAIWRFQRRTRVPSACHISDCILSFWLSPFPSLALSNQELTHCCKQGLLTGHAVQRSPGFLAMGPLQSRRHKRV